MSEPDLSEFEALERKRTRHRPPCGLAAVLDQVSKDELPSLKAALAADRTLISNKAIEEWLGKREIKCGLQIVSAHRRGVCSCHD